MTWWAVFSLLAWFPLQEAFPMNSTNFFVVNHTNAMLTQQMVFLEEGQMLVLKCVFSQENNSSLQWLAPSGFTIFFNDHPALKNSRFQLLHYSANELSIRLPNITVQDEGDYKCLCYNSTSVKTVEIRVVVLATPSQAFLEVSPIECQNAKPHVVLTCYSVRSKPAPQITWRLDNRIEVSGGDFHSLEPDKKKSNTTSILHVHEYYKNSTVDCIVRHQGLRNGELIKTFQFKDLVTDQKDSSDAWETSVPSSQSPQHSTGAEENRKLLGLTSKKNGIILLTLVSFLVLALFIIVQLFIMRLWKAHVIWKKETDIPGPTVDKNKSRSNTEETSSQDKNGQS